MKKDIRTVIIDDDEDWRDNLSDRVEAHPRLILLASFESPIAAYDLITEGVVDLILLDIEMPDINGVEFIRYLSKPPKVIFITSHRDFAFESYEVKAVDYLLKPLSVGRFMQAIEKVVEQIQSNEMTKSVLHEKFFFIRENNSFVKIEINHILFIKSLENYIQIVTPDHTYTTLMSLSTAEENLPNALFLRVHRSFLVNITKITVVQKTELFIETTEIPIGRAYADIVFNSLIKMYSISKN